MKSRPIVLNRFLVDFPRIPGGLARLDGLERCSDQFECVGYKFDRWWDGREFLANSLMTVQVTLDH